MLHKHLLLLILSVISVNSTISWHYHNNTALENFLKNFTATTKSIQSRLYSIGQTRKNNNLWVLELTAVKTDRLGIPNIKLIGTIHGNEPVGREILLHFAEYLRDEYGKNPEVTWLMDNAKLHLLPNLNPEGFALSHKDMCTGTMGRSTTRTGPDLNRNFPDYYHNNSHPELRETKAVRNWLKEIPFILSGALHGGALVVNYPFDTVREFTSEDFNPASLTPDNDVFMHLARTYSENHPEMKNGTRWNRRIFENGITNGAVWYPFIGGMQDYNYAFHGCMELTLEISKCKYPNEKELPKLFTQNKIVVIKQHSYGLKGITGVILNQQTRKPIPGATLRISGRKIDFFSSKTGEFWRLLLPGNYSLEISALGYYNQNMTFQVKACNDSKPELMFLKVLLLNSSVSTTSTFKKSTIGTTASTTTTTKFRAIEIVPRTASFKGTSSSSGGGYFTCFVFFKSIYVIIAIYKLFLSSLLTYECVL